MDFPVRIEHFRFPGPPWNIFYFGVCSVKIMSHMRIKTKSTGALSNGVGGWRQQVPSRWRLFDYTRKVKRLANDQYTTYARLHGFRHEMKKTGRSALVTRKIYLNVARLTFREYCESVQITTPSFNSKLNRLGILLKEDNQVKWGNSSKIRFQVNEMFKCSY